jgi:hypothetical protein
MTTAERLVKNIFDHRREQLIQERNDEVSKVSDDTPFSKLPREARSAFKILERLQPRVRAAEKIIEKAGFRADLENGHIPLEVSPRRGYQEQDKKKLEVRKSYDLRLRQLEDLFTTSRIHVMGMPQQDARGFLTELQQKVASI